MPGSGGCCRLPSSLGAGGCCRLASSMPGRGLLYCHYLKVELKSSELSREDPKMMIDHCRLASSLGAGGNCRLPSVLCWRLLPLGHLLLPPHPPQPQPVPRPDRRQL